MYTTTRNCTQPTIICMYVFCCLPVTVLLVYYFASKKNSITDKCKTTNYLTEKFGRTLNTKQPRGINTFSVFVSIGSNNLIFVSIESNNQISPRETAVNGGRKL